MVSGSISLVRANDQDFNFYVTNTDDGTPYNLSGCTLTYDMRRFTYYDPILLHRPLDIYGPDSGAALLSFTTGDTAGLDNLPYFFTVNLVSAAGKTTTLLAGNTYVLPFQQ